MSANALRSLASRTTSLKIPAVRALTMRASLMMLSGPELGALKLLAPGRPLVIGRDSDADLVIPDASVSRRHATIEADGLTARVRDLGSRNGTFVRGERVVEHGLADGDKLQLGAVTLKFALTDELDEECQRLLVEAALYDSLTGVPNRRHFDERLTAEVSAARRFGDPLSLVLIDVDHFKRINDLYGHPTGDAVLRVVAQTLDHAVREEDALARIGGEEFAVLARGTDLDGAVHLAERLRREVAAAVCLFEGTALSVTVSAGVATLSPDAGSARLVELADAALYRAKHSGRDRVTAA